MATQSPPVILMTPLSDTVASSDAAGTAVVPSAATVPELRDAEYDAAVLQLSEHTTERQIDNELVSKASALGISTDASTTADKRITSSVESASTVFNARTFSMLSAGSTSTALTNHSSLFGPPTPDLRLHVLVGESKDLNFAQYDKYIAITDPHHSHKYLKQPDPADVANQSVFSGKTKRSIFSVTSGLKNRMRWRRKAPQPIETIISCASCHADFNNSNSLRQIHCGHSYCADCLRSLLHQAMKDESNMPPRCCTQPIPGSIIKDMLNLHDQQEFLKAVIQYSTPWESRIFCPSATCGEFIPPHLKVDLKHPFNVTCRKCNTHVCVMCKRSAHPTGKDCPEDWELHQVLKTGDGPGWKRCYKCRDLVALEAGSTEMTCKCSAKFCYICSGVWDDAVGCPNYCDGEEEMERRKREEAAHLAEYEAEKATQEAAAAAAAAERLEAEERTRNHADFTTMSETQEEEMRRFQEFVAQARTNMRARHVEKRAALVEKQAEQEEKMKERHTKTISHLEDRQVAAEMDLRSTLEQSERSVKIRLKHMEAYCDGLGRNPATSSLPPRVVTERDLRELGQQYNLRDGMERLHDAKINVMRDRQAKRMEELIDRQETEYEKLIDRGHDEIDEFTTQCANEEEILTSTFAARRTKLVRRWELAVEVLRKELEAQTGLKYAPIPMPTWPEDTNSTSSPTSPKSTAAEDVEAV